MNKTDLESWIDSFENDFEYQNNNIVIRFHKAYQSRVQEIRELKALGISL